MALGDIALKENQLQSAQEKYQRALQIAPRHPAANLAMAQFWEAQDKTEEAIRAYNQAARVSNSPEVYRKIAQLNLQRNYVSAAIVAYRQLLERFPNDAATYLALGQILAEQKRTSEARQMLERASVLYSNDPANLSVIRNLLDKL